MAPVEITEAEILEALRESFGDSGPADAFTRAEIAEAMGWGVDRTSSQLTRIKRRGQLEVVKVQRETLDCRMVTVPGYRFLKAKGKR